MSSFPSTQNGLVYIGPNSFSVSGDYTNIFKPYRALVATISAALVYGIYVVSATYANGVTTVLTKGTPLADGLTGIQLGQDPDNAPSADRATNVALATGKRQAIIFG